ncbi:MAG: FKBP-type peptidyl-prolyl cis-trans isomerase [Clostridiales bacterium]|nr:FKBP-type peptidyl-prolyl cis-trans isomerase [Clostridiales bacterium]
MKKLLVVLLIAVLAVGTLTACGGSSSSEETGTKTYTFDMAPYDDMDLSEYVTVPEDLSKYEYKVETTEITDEDVEKEIKDRLSKAATEVEVTEGTVEKGDKARIAFKGTLEDGTTNDGMNTDSMDIVLGEAGFIDGFEEGLYGAKIGDTVTLDLKFPDPYNNNPDLAGKGVTFEVTVKAKVESKDAELNEEFIKNDSQNAATNEKDYKEYIKKTLQENADNQAEYNAKQALYQSILNDCEVLKYPEEEVEATKARLIEQYKSYAESSQMEWEDFIKNNFESEDNFNTQLDTYVRETLVGVNMKVLALCKQEGVSLTDEEYNEEIQNIFAAFNVANEEEFQTQYNTSFEDYLSAYDVKLNLLVSRLLNKITGTEE